MRDGDERARRILERTETLPPEHFQKLHGAMRGLAPGGTNERVGMAASRRQAVARIGAGSRRRNQAGRPRSPASASRRAT